MSNEVNGIHQYVRDENRKPIGVLAAVEQNGVVGIGASVCNPKDKFDPKLGIVKARGRALSGAQRGVNKPIPVTLKESNSLLRQFQVRAEKFFKDKEVVLDFE